MFGNLVPPWKGDSNQQSGIQSAEPAFSGFTEAISIFLYLPPKEVSSSKKFQSKVAT